MRQDSDNVGTNARTRELPLKRYRDKVNDVGDKSPLFIEIEDDTTAEKDNIEAPTPFVY